MKIDDREIRELMRKALQGRIDKNDLTGTEKVNILFLARQDKMKELQFIHELLKVNPEKTFIELLNSSEKYKDCIKLIDWLDPEQQNLPKCPHKKRAELKTYLWTKQPAKQLPELYKRLSDGGFIGPQTSLETFTACFNGQPVKSITEKIKWLESKVLLAYFLNSLIIGQKIPQKTNLWSISKLVFDDAANLKQAKGNFVAYGYPDGHDRIDQILSDL